MSGFFQSVLDAIVAAVTWLQGLAQSVSDSVFIIIKNAFLWALDGVLGVVVSAISAISFTIPGLSSYWSQVPADIINVLSLVGFADALGVIAVAIAVRLALQLIPFVRLGS